MDGLTQGHRLSQGDAHLFAQARTFRIIHFDGVSASIVLVDLAARAGTILATRHAIFISFRELISAVPPFRDHRGRPRAAMGVDVLSTRAADSVATWLAAHPSIRTISRDRHGPYAEAIRHGAP